ncbi:MAG: glycosyltransferase, partial [Myxococcales bacterium]|nr:glycosyltransferase [Myxococcales bacterium]
MSDGLHWVLAGLLWAWTAAVVGTSGVAMLRALRRRARPHARPAPAPRPSVVVVRPCAGLEPHLGRTLRSTGSLRYDGPLRVVLTTTAANDPAQPLLHRVAAELRHAGMDAQARVIPACGTNLKASQLSGVVDLGHDEIAVVVDSDVDLHALDLEALIAPLCDRHDRVAAVWCAPVEREPAGAGDRLSSAVLGGSLHAFPLLGALDPGGLVGKTFAVRCDALRETGGFAGLVQHLGEDMELARRLAERGWTTHMSPRVVGSLASGRSVGSVLDRYVRWLMVIRAQRPALLLSYPLLLAATPGLVLAAVLGERVGLPGAAFAGLLVGLA